MRVLRLNSENVDEFNKLMINNKQKVICKVWAPWCGHCIELNKIWPSIENKIRKIKGEGLLVSIVETMIPSVNCLDSREVPGYPWIFSMKGGRGKKKEYNGRRNVESLVKYIEKKMKKRKTIKTKKKRKTIKTKKTRVKRRTRVKRKHNKKKTRKKRGGFTPTELASWETQKLLREGRDRKFHGEAVEELQGVYRTDTMQKKEKGINVSELQCSVKIGTEEIKGKCGAAFNARRDKALEAEAKRKRLSPENKLNRKKYI